MRHRPLALVLALVLLLTACTPGAEVADPTDGGSPATAEATPADPRPSTSAPATTEPVAMPDDDDDDGVRRELVEAPFEEACRVPGEEYCQDDNDNGWPDVIEADAGWDPSVDGCLATDCPGASIDELLLSLQDNTLFILDASGSMAGEAGGGQTKMAAAKEALVAYAQGSPEFADLGLMVYGHHGDNSDAGRDESCAGVEVMAEVGAFGPGSAADAVAGFEATGWTPIGAALEAAGPVLQAAADADVAEGIDGATNRIILISDGIETCGGDPVAAAQALVDLGIEVVVDVIGFDLAESDRASLQQVAEVTGGRYTDAAGGRALREVLAAYQRQIYEAVEPISCQRRAMARFATCRNELAADMAQEFNALAREALDAGDRELGLFWSDWYGPLWDAYHAQSEQRLAELDETLQRFMDEVEAARQRQSDLLSGASGQKVSSAQHERFDCPFDEAVEVV